LKDSDVNLDGQWANADKQQAERKPRPVPLHTNADVDVAF
jgi:hypothetical protein